MLVLEVEFLVWETIAETTTTTNRRALLCPLLYTKQDIVCFCVFLSQIEGVVRGNVFDAIFFGIGEQLGIGMVFLVQTVSIELKIKIFFKVFVPPLQGFAGLLLPYVQVERRYFPAQTTAEYDEVLFVLEKDLFINTRNIIITMQLPFTAELGEIVIPIFILREQDNLVPVVFFGAV